MFKYRRLKLGLVNALLIVLSIITLIPIVYAFSVSVNGSNSLFSSELSLLPKEITFANYAAIIQDKPFLAWLKNSLILSLLTVVFTMLVTIPAAYSYSRYKFSGKEKLGNLLLLLNAFPTILSMFAIYRMMKILHLINTMTGLILIYGGTIAIFAFWSMKGYFDSISVDMEEAARIDGANDLQLIKKIIMPLAMPNIIVTSVLVFITAWNEYIFATIFITGEANYTLALGLFSLQATDYSRNWPLFSAAAILTSIPVLFVFFYIQKHVVSGLSSGGVKG